jgi:hypothetical protein
MRAACLAGGAARQLAVDAALQGSGEQCSRFHQISWHVVNSIKSRDMYIVSQPARDPARARNMGIDELLLLFSALQAQAGQPVSKQAERAGAGSSS